MTSLFPLRPEARDAKMSGIDAVIKHGRGRADIIALWSGEGDLVTPSFISDAAIRSLNDGETFYTWQSGIPDLRQALARYHYRHFGCEFTEQDFTVTIGGMHAIVLALQATAGAEKEVIYLTPAWPNFAAAAEIAGAKAVAVPLNEGVDGWQCDMDLLRAAVTPRTTAIFINTPSNPTGWTADIGNLRVILDFARHHDLWIIADEIYSLFNLDGPERLPSFFDVMDPQDRIIFVNTMSKNWAMTGWRVGWLSTHPSLSQVFENLVQYSSSGVAQFAQRGAVAALDYGDSFVKEQVARATAGRDLLCDILRRTGRVRFSVPRGAFYLLFKVDGVNDSLAAACDLIDLAGVGVAPGTAFGSDGQGYFRICFLRDIEQLRDAAERINKWIVAL